MILYGSLALAARDAEQDDPGGLAVVDGSHRWSRRELDERADAAALGLLAAGVAAGDRVALLAGASAAAVAVVHAIARIGAVAAPLVTDLAAAELAAAAAIVDPRVVVHDDRRASAAAAAGRPALRLEPLVDPAVHPGPRSNADAPAGPAAPTASAGPGAPTAPVAPTAPAAPAGPAVIVMTSGTTGGPKAAILSASALIASAEAWLAFLPPATGWLLALGLGHVAGLGVVWRAALSGVPLVIAPRADAAQLLAGLREDPAPSHVSLVPTQLARLLDAAADGPPPDTLRAVLLGGGAISADLVRRAITAGWPVVPTYGLTEAGSGVTALPTAEAAAHPESAGRPLPGVELRIVAPDRHGVGVIEVRSPGLFSGYLGDAEATAAALDVEGWLRTGDLGHIDPDGRLVVHDRRSDRIVRGGENVSPLEVETVLLEHPAVADAAVVARRDDVWGQLPVAAIVLRAGAVDPGDAALADHCRRRLAGHKVPVEFIRVERLPRTSTGKLRRAEVRARMGGVAAEQSLTGPPERALTASAELRTLDRPGEARLAYRRHGAGPVPLLLLHGTLSTGAQLRGLADALASSGPFTVLAVDRRGSGESRLAEPAALPVQVHVDDLVAVLDAEHCGAAAVLGISFGGVVGIEFAARVPVRTLAVVAWEPPYGPLADAATRRAFETVATATERAYIYGGPARAAEAFLRGVAGDAAWERLGRRARSFLAAEGGGARADAALAGLDPDGLARIGAPVALLTGDASEAFYGPISDALVGRIAGAQRVRLPGMGHAAPITAPARIAEGAIRAFEVAGIIPSGRPATAGDGGGPGG